MGSAVTCLSAGCVPGQSWSAVSAKRAELEGKRGTTHMATPEK